MRSMNRRACVRSLSLNPLSSVALLRPSIAVNARLTACALSVANTSFWRRFSGFSRRSTSPDSSSMHKARAARAPLTEAHSASSSCVRPPRSNTADKNGTVPYRTPGRSNSSSQLLSTIRCSRCSRPARYEIDFALLSTIDSMCLFCSVNVLIVVRFINDNPPNVNSHGPREPGLFK